MKQKFRDAYMKTAEVFAELSSARRLHVGAIVVKDEKTGKTSARSLDVEMNRVVTNGQTGEQEIQKLYNKVPMLPLVPLPSLAITSAMIKIGEQTHVAKSLYVHSNSVIYVK